MGRKKKKSFILLYFLIAVLAIMVIAYVIHTERKKTIESPRPAPKAAVPAQKAPRQEPQRDLVGEIIKKHEVTPTPGKSDSSAHGRQIAIIIDDLGGDLSAVHELLKIDAPLTFAILPYTPHAIDTAHTLHQAGKEILLHLPMEPVSYPEAKPGKGALLVNMGNDDLLKLLEKDLEAVPYISGVNNHMGSRFMADREKLAVVLKRLKQKGLFFVDSRTTPHTRASEMAEKIGIPMVERKVFIDNGHHYETTYQNLIQLLEKQKKSSEPLVIIGHPHRSTIEALKKVIPRIKAEGIDVVPISKVVSVPDRNLTRK